MKIRATKAFFYTDLTEEDLKCQILNDLEAPEYPQVISNNECSVVINAETDKVHSPISFLAKFKASNVSPSLVPSGVSGIELPNGHSNTKVHDGLSHFTSVNENHHDLTLKDEEELNDFIAKIRLISPHYHSFDINELKKYLLRTLDESEWKSFYKKDKKWNKFKNKMLEENFRNKHCPITKQDIQKYLQATHDELEDDLKLLKKYGAITDTNKLKILSQFFPSVFPK